VTRIVQIPLKRGQKEKQQLHPPEKIPIRKNGRLDTILNLGLLIEGQKIREIISIRKLSIKSKLGGETDLLQLNE